MSIKLKHCHFPWSDLFIRRNGRIQPCCMNSTELGNINSNSIEDAWNSDIMQTIRKNILDNNYSDSGCNPECEIVRKLSTVNEFPVELTKGVPENTQVYDNINQSIQSIEKRETIVQSFPYSFDIQTNELCNMDCIMCKQDHHAKEHIDSELYSKILMNMKYIRNVRFQGGEVFTDKKFYASMLKLKQRLKPHQTITIIINGSIITHEMIDNMVDGDNPIKFIISIDSPEEKTFKKIRVTNQFKTVWSNLEYFSKKQQESNSGCDDIIKWNYMISKSTIFDVKKSLDIAHKLKTIIVFNPIVGPYPEENIYQYKDIFNMKQLDYLKECLEHVNKNNIKQIGLERIIRNLKHYEA